MRNSNYQPHLLKASIDGRVISAQDAVNRAAVLAENLGKTGEEYSVYAHDHAAERLESIAKVLEEQARGLRSLIPYTNYPPIEHQ
jgi:hypothetical protein